MVQALKLEHIENEQNDHHLIEWPLYRLNLGLCHFFLRSSSFQAIWCTSLV